MKIYNIGNSKILIIGNADRSSEIIHGHSDINHVIGSSKQLKKFWKDIKPALTGYVTVQTDDCHITCAVNQIDIQFDFIDERY